MTTDLNRRRFLISALAGCSAAASPILTPVTMASAPWDNRVVVIILRGAMDGLDAVRPVGDPDFAGLQDGKLRGGEEEPLMLDNFFALHPALSDLMPLWQAGELSFAHATSTPYRDKRSHFDGQMVLEAGSGNDVDGRPRDGWLNRLMQIAPGVEASTAFAVGRSRMAILDGEGPYSLWEPRTGLNVSPQAERLLELIYHDDPLFRDAATQAFEIVGDIDAEPDPSDEMSADMNMMAEVSGNGSLNAEVAKFVVERLRNETRIATFSINGWDTHVRQGQTLPNRLRGLARTILMLKAGLGPVWSKTSVLVMTEFGRTARINGTGGTDHGTAGAMLMAGGAIRGGRVLGDWPGLRVADLYQGRDLLPTRDIRAYAGWTMRGMFGTSSSDIERVLFPGLELGADPRLLL